MSRVTFELPSVPIRYVGIADSLDHIKRFKKSVVLILNINNVTNRLIKEVLQTKTQIIIVSTIEDHIPNYLSKIHEQDHCIFVRTSVVVDDVHDVLIEYYAMRFKNPVIVTSCETHDLRLANGRSITRIRNNISALAYLILQFPNIEFDQKAKKELDAIARCMFRLAPKTYGQLLDHTRCVYRNRVLGINTIMLANTFARIWKWSENTWLIAKKSDFTSSQLKLEIRYCLRTSIMEFCEDYDLNYEDFMDWYKYNGSLSDSIRTGLVSWINDRE